MNEPPRLPAAALAALFGLFFSAYLLTASGTLPPYRDAGEMVSSAATLGVSHPPGYPAYVLLGKLAASFGSGSAAYRLNVLSAAAAAGAVAASAWAAAPVAGAWAMLGAVLLGLDRTFWQVAQVPEMYSLGLLCACLCLGLAVRLRLEWSERRACLLGLMFGLSLGVRMDLLLLGPCLLALPFRSWGEAALRRAAVLRALAFFALGFAAFLYLPVRASGGPWLDWADPSSFSRFLNAITRHSYGGTLDLLSREYETGRNFDANLSSWGGHLWRAYGPLAALALPGLAALGGLGPALGALLAGPVFLFLANLPPNPHALAIVEPHYLTADIVLAAAVSAGAARLARDARYGRALAFAGAAACLFFASRRADSVRRWELLALDSADSQLRAVPPGGRLVAKKDVQLFSLWHAREVLGRRRDAAVVAQGLSGSDWYRAGAAKEHPSLALRRLSLQENWKPFLEENGAVQATMDSEWPQSLPSSPRGLAVRVSASPEPPDSRPWLDLVCLRARLDYDAQSDFFSSDLVGDYSSARHRAAYADLQAGRLEQAYRGFALSWAAKRLWPEGPLYMGLIRFQQGRAPEADRLFGLSARLFEEELALTSAYRSLPSLTEAVRKASATALVNQGAAAERLGRREEALAHYELASARDPSMAQAHYNLAVLFWGRDWARVRRELQETLRLAPGHPEASRYLAKLPK